MDTLPCFLWYQETSTSSALFLIHRAYERLHWKPLTASAAHWNPLVELIGMQPLRAVLSWPPGTSLSPGVVGEETGGQPSLTLPSPAQMRADSAVHTKVKMLHEKDTFGLNVSSLSRKKIAPLLPMCVTSSPRQAQQ